MSLKERLLANLPPFENKKVTIKQRQGTTDIINSVINTHAEHAEDYDNIYEAFDTGDIYKTSRKIWEFLKYNFKYNAEPGSDQSVKSPAAILQPGENVDCKHYALFAGGVLDAILRNNPGDQWDWCYRFVSDRSQTDVSHVFIVVFDRGSEIWIDPCLTSFDQKKKYTLTKDYKPMLSKISGVEDVKKPIQIIAPDGVLNFQSFLTLVQMDAFSLKQLMKKNMQITSTKFKQYCEENGYDYNHFLNFLNT